MFFLFISGQEIIVIAVLLIMLFGAKRIPEIARGLGQGMRQVKDATNDIKREINESVKKEGVDTNIAKEIREEINEVKKDINEVTGAVKRDL
ncbi:MAG: twin-arginine translocase TatA/TatE family subunit [Flavobacteriaceae bacterium]|nr:MAG: twin-arginine translocase TatA/TatE family subunit [Flavobacteriaceae bacterium]